METYSAFGLGIRSELPLPELAPSAVEPDIYIRIGAIESASYRPIDSPDSYLALTEFGRILVNNGCEIVVEPIVGTNEGAMRAMILGPVLAFMLRLRGDFVLHASSVVVNGEAIAFVGNSGSGKSTLAKAFHMQGFPIVTDDVLAVDLRSSRPMIVPSFPLLKLWPDTASALGEDLTRYSKMHSETDKLIHHLSDGFHSGLLPLKRIYFLGKGDRLTITDLSGHEALANLMVHTWGIDSLTATQHANVQLQQCARLINEVPMFCLQRPIDLMLLPQVIQNVLCDLETK